MDSTSASSYPQGPAETPGSLETSTAVHPRHRRPHGPRRSSSRSSRAATSTFADGELPFQLPSVTQLVAAVHESPRWLFAATLVFAPWAYGSTRLVAFEILQWLMGGVLALWLVSCLLRRTVPVIHPVLLVVVPCLIGQAWWMTANAHFVVAGDFVPQSVDSWISALPGSINRNLSLPMATHVTLMLGVACFAADLARRSVWRHRLWWTMALTGVSIVMLGLAQKLTEAPGVFWVNEKFGETFFATYRYHANAGAFLNIVWPLVAGLMALSLRTGESRWAKIFWPASFGLVVAGVFANTSRASGLIAAGMLLLWLLWFVVGTLRGRMKIASPAVVVSVVFFLLTLVVVVGGLGGFEATFERWNQVDKQFTTRNSRLLVAGVCVDMLPQSGWWGFGPGTFQTAFPFFNRNVGEETRGVWLHAHQDYLQTLVEWGYVGATVWGVLVLGGILGSSWWVLRYRRRLSRRDRVLHFTACCGLFALLVHAMGDFPFQIASIQLYVVTLLGLLWSVSGWNSHHDDEPAI